MKYWLIKSEESCYSIDDLKRDKKTLWTGIRNYQARNLMREMEVGDLCLFYHSSCPVIGVYGVAEVVRRAIPDPTQFDRKDEHFDPKSTKEKPIWDAVEVKFREKFEHPVTLEKIKSDPKLLGIAVAERGSRLSVQRVSEKHFQVIVGR